MLKKKNYFRVLSHLFDEDWPNETPLWFAYVAYTDTLWVIEF